MVPIALQQKTLADGQSNTEEFTYIDRTGHTLPSQALHYIIRLHSLPGYILCGPETIEPFLVKIETQEQELLDITYGFI